MTIVNKTQLAEIIGKTPQTLTTWQKNGLPIHSDGTRGQANQYDTVEVIAWLLRREVGKLTVGEDGTVHDYEAERARLTHHQANKTELESDVLRGRLIPAKTVEAVQGKIIGAFRAKCLSLPTKIAPRLGYLTEVVEIENEIRTAIYDALSELSEFSLEQYGISAVRPDGADGSAAADADGESMG